MKASKQQRGCKALCCSSNRFSVSSSSEEAESSSSASNRFPSVSTLAHAMVQERLDQMIREKLEATRYVERRREQRRRSEGTKFVVMLAMEKCSYDPREDFRESMMEMITTNRLQDAKDLRSLLNYYMSMNSEEYHSLILEIFHEVCTNLFLSWSKCKW
ncbi:unnamed protein product [Trifolium pratense]|uniref:Uncharacterized protein n=1 Tax=Trifolium pratense TaxID=57577 RepID=A0ACB0K025_TRIPR|nr:unnamed protein product [Trifolium pratense]